MVKDIKKQDKNLQLQGGKSLVETGIESMKMPARMEANFCELSLIIVDVKSSIKTPNDKG